MIKNEDVDKELYEKYNDFNKNQPKKELLNLKKDKNMTQMLLSMSQNSIVIKQAEGITTFHILQTTT